MKNEISKKRTSEDSYEILVNGSCIGSVYKAWHRLGGSGWMISGCQKYGTYKTIKKAIARMVRDAHTLKGHPIDLSDDFGHGSESITAVYSECNK